MTLPHIGIDPGKSSGGVVHLSPDGRRVLGWAAWWRSGKRLRFESDHQRARSVDRWQDVLVLLSRWRRLDHFRLTVEGLFIVPRRGTSSPASVLQLGESAGALLGLFVDGADGEVLRPRAMEEWRPLVLGLSKRTRASQAEAYAVDRAPLLFEWQGGFPALPKRALGAVAEAACIARWGWVQHRQRDIVAAL